MNFKIRKQLRDKTRHVYGLTEVLKCDIDILRKDASACNLDKLRESIREADITLQKLIMVMGQIEYILKQDIQEGP